MSHLNRYKVGATLFRILSEGRMQLNVLQNALRYNSTPPTSIIEVRDYLASPNNTYKKINAGQVFPFPRTQIYPEMARPLLEKQNQIDFPETFVLTIPNGRVLGDGTVVTEDNAILSESTTDFHRKQQFHRLLSERSVPTPTRFDGRLAVITSPGSNNYFHWTLDSLPRLSLLRGMTDEIDGYYIDSRSRFHLEWLDILEIPKDKIITASPEHHIEATELIVPSFAGVAGLPSPDGLDFVRSFLPSKPNNRRRIYISRSGARRRKILNEKELLPILQRNGFETIQPGSMTVAEQMETFSSADVVVSPHGAELTNIAYCAPETKIIELFSPYYINPCFKNLAALCKLQHTALIGTGGESLLRKRKDAHFLWANIKMDLASLEKTMHKLPAIQERKTPQKNEKNL